MDAFDPSRLLVNHPLDCGPLIDDLAAVPRDATRLSVAKETANLALLPQFTHVQSLRLTAVPQPIMDDALATMTALAELDIYGARITSLAGLTGLPLRRLRLIWAHQISDLGPIGTLHRLEVLTIGDMKRAHDFSPLAGCRALKALHLEAGMWGSQKVDSLAFLRSLPQLEELSMHYLALAEVDLSPICALTNLRYLHLPTKYPLREYARLAVCLPNTTCEAFASHVTYTVGTLTDLHSDNAYTYTEHVILVGKPSRGFARTDPRCAPAIAKREALLERWRSHYSAVADPASDRREKLD